MFSSDSNRVDKAGVGRRLLHLVASSRIYYIFSIRPLGHDSLRQQLCHTRHKLAILKGLEPSFTGRQPVAFPDGNRTINSAVLPVLHRAE